jgi:hypothetical protein
MAIRRTILRKNRERRTFATGDEALTGTEQSDMIEWFACTIRAPSGACLWSGSVALGSLKVSFLLQVSASAQIS